MPVRQGLLVLLLAQKYNTGKIVLPDDVLETIQEARHLIEAHMGEQLCVEDIDMATGMSVIDFRKCFKIVTGKSPADFITQARVNNGKLLLQQTDKPIKEIAGMCGYVSTAKFIQAFKKSFWYTPMRWRKRSVKTN